MSQNTGPGKIVNDTLKQKYRQSFTNSFVMVVDKFTHHNYRNIFVFTHRIRNKSATIRPGCALILRNSRGGVVGCPLIRINLRGRGGLAGLCTCALVHHGGRAVPYLLLMGEHGNKLEYIIHTYTCM